MYIFYVYLYIYSEEERDDEIISEFKNTLAAVETSVKTLYAAALEQDTR